MLYLYHAYCSISWLVFISPVRYRRHGSHRIRFSYGKHPATHIQCSFTNEKCISYAITNRKRLYDFFFFSSAGVWCVCVVRALILLVSHTHQYEFDVTNSCYMIFQWYMNEIKIFIPIPYLCCFLLFRAASFFLSPGCCCNYTCQHHIHRMRIARLYSFIIVEYCEMEENLNNYNKKQ